MNSTLRLLVLLLLLTPLVECTHHHPAPTESEEGESGMLHKRDLYFDLSHRAAPGIDWRRENERVMTEAYAALSKKNAPEGGTQSYAGGKIQAAWLERGSANQAGSMIALDYVPATNQIYSISDAGTLWRGPLDGNNWINLNRDLRFDNRRLQVIPKPGGGQRILTVIGKKVWYSDDEGATFTQSTGWNFYDGWGGPIQLIAANDGTNIRIYYTVLTWDATPWAARVQVYYSANMGQTFSLVTTLAHGESGQVSMWHPYNTGDCYLLNQSSKLYKFNVATLTQIGANSTLPTGVDCQLRGYRSNGGSVTFYVMTDGKKIWRSTNNGISWQLRSSVDPGAWSVGMEVSLSDPNKVFYGNVDAYRSTDGGSTWNTVNEWWEYYGNVPGKLHADIMDIEFYRNAANQEFALISNHGGIAVSYDGLQTTTNLSLTGLNVSQYYSVRTDPHNPDFVYAGAQDQGYQRASTAAAMPKDPLDFVQIVSGDYGQMVFSANGTHFWKQYPGGSMSYHHFPQTSNAWSDSGWDLTGDDKPNVGWMVPTSELSDEPSRNTILLGGGNINGGPGSYLIELTADTSAPYDITAVQDPFDFKTNSNNGSSLITAIAVDSLNGRRYVATDDGTFFYKNKGGSWTKATGFTGPGGFYLYGACVLPSKLNPDLVWYTGSGYSNPTVWKSTDGGKTFSAMSNGLPSTLVQAVAASPDEKFLFAATDAGPFVYSTETNVWYPLRNGDMPLQSIFNVEYIPSRHLVRFGTFGRGIWDFALDNLAVDGITYPAACGPASGEINIITQNGLSPYTYAWSNGATSRNVTGLASGSYTVTVTDANGFAHTRTFQVGGTGKPSKPYNLTVPDVACQEVSVTWQGPATGTYQLRYRQGNDLVWTVLPDIGNVFSYTMQMDLSKGPHYEYAVRYVCPSNWQSAWVSKSGTLTCTIPKTTFATEENHAPTGNRLLVFPNPAHSLVNIRLEDNTTEPIEIRLYDCSGRLIKYEPELFPTDSGYHFSVEGLPGGIYWVSAGTGLTAKLFVH
jgi:hypothetical protein